MYKYNLSYLGILLMIQIRPASAAQSPETDPTQSRT